MEGWGGFGRLGCRTGCWERDREREREREIWGEGMI